MSLHFSSTVSLCHVLSYDGVEMEMTGTRTKSFFHVFVSFSSSITEKKEGRSKKERLKDNEQDYLTGKKKELIVLKQ